MSSIISNIRIIIALIIEAISTGRAVAVQLNNGLYARVAYMPRSFGIGVDLYISPEFSLDVDLGPFTFGIGREQF